MTLSLTLFGMRLISGRGPDNESFADLNAVGLLKKRPSASNNGPFRALGGLKMIKHRLTDLMDIRRGYFLIVLACHALSSPCFAADVLTYHNDNARTGWNPNEVVLTPSNVNASSFGLLFNLLVDGKVDAQPLYVSNAAVFGGSTSLGSHNLVIVATEHDSAYAFDADTGTLYWHASFVGPGETPSDDRGCSQVIPEIGVTATPVIDRNSGANGTNGTIYLVAMSKSATAYHQRLHVLNLATGQEVPGSPVEIQASYAGSGPHNDGNGHVIFDPGAYKERPGLLLLNGTVYTAWSSHCDIAPYTSWIIGYDEKTLAQNRVLNLDPNGAPNSTFLSDGSGNSFWNSGAGPAADATGNIYALSANGPFDTALLNGFPSHGDYGDTFLKLATPGSLAVSDYFTPFDQATDAQNDTDLGSGGAIVLPDMTDGSGEIRHLAVGAGKDSNIYLVDRDNMGKFVPGATSNSYIYQELVGALPGGEFGTAAYFNGSIYYGPVGGALRRFTFTQARLDPGPAAVTGTIFAYPGVTPSISSSGNTAGIVWAYENSGNNQAVLHAYDGTSLQELYNSNQDQFGQANKFITPTVCNGKVFVATQNSVAVFGPTRAQGYVNPDYSDPGYQNVSVTYTLTNGGLPSQATVALNGSGTVNARVSWPAPGATQWSTVTANGQVLAEGSQWVPWGSPTVIVILSYPFTSSPTTFTVSGSAPAQGYVNPDYSGTGYQNVNVTYTLTNGGLPSQATVALNGSGTVNARVSWPAPSATQWSTVTANGQVLAEGSQWVPWGSPTVIVILSYPFTSSPTTFTVF
jgi:hypothetical protein